MSLHPKPIGPVPEETARIAHAVFPRGSAHLPLREELGPIYDDEAFAAPSLRADNRRRRRGV